MAEISPSRRNPGLVRLDAEITEQIDAVKALLGHRASRTSVATVILRAVLPRIKSKCRTERSIKLDGVEVLI